MRVFVTGATGFIGSAVVRELLGAGHQVLGLARSDAAGTALKEAGAQVHRGDLTDIDGLRAAAEATDGVIHTGYHHDFSDMPGALRIELGALKAFGDALAESGRPLVVTSVTGLLTPGRLGTEADTPDPAGPGAHRAEAERAALALADRGVRVSAIRLPQVHGAGDHAFVPLLIGTARTKGVAAYLGDGTNRWSSVHRLDAATLYRKALEAAPAGAVLHAVADEGVPLRAVTEVIGRRLGLPVVSLTGEDAADHFGWMAAFVGNDNPTSGAATRERYDWRPAQPGLLADLDQDHYFG
ncbi:SDR family oxidoreductase [Streptomyces fuscichromogenes]|uniref:UDP-glucose 4-epimerase n=1 Tax=Streptomyces fuscichromogenes TaxID=1324013 RepID=A0A917XIM1_9ACTN|nr:SDR family oxidoreductase [Streptomyces fuscichromogenes]GGN29749.1 UDP-glucose 4-epimerase [Streptomyces fuscichromogenes]